MWELQCDAWKLIQVGVPVGLERPFIEAVKPLRGYQPYASPPLGACGLFLGLAFIEGCFGGRERQRPSTLLAAGAKERLCLSTTCVVAAAAKEALSGQISAGWAASPTHCLTVQAVSLAQSIPRLADYTRVYCLIYYRQFQLHSRLWAARICITLSFVAYLLT